MAGVNPRISVIGLYNYDANLFANMWVPTGINKPVLVDNLLMELGELQVIYPDPVFMKQAIEQWSFTKVRQWTRLYDALHEDYDPLWNKDGTRTETRDLKGTGKSESTGKVSAYNDNDFVNAEHGDSEGETTDTGTITIVEQGNIGVTTSQSMLHDEIELWSSAETNLHQIIIEEFKQRFCIMVY